MLEGAQRLRFAVYCQELKRNSPYTNHDKKIISDLLDDAGCLNKQDIANWRIKIDTAAAFLVQRTGDEARWMRFRNSFKRRLLDPDLFYYCTMI
jgi:hypothetical protein